MALRAGRHDPVSCDPHHWDDRQYARQLIARTEGLYFQGNSAGVEPQRGESHGAIGLQGGDTSSNGRRIFGAVIVTLVLLLGILATVRPATAQGPRMALASHCPPVDHGINSRCLVLTDRLGKLIAMT